MALLYFPNLDKARKATALDVDLIPAFGFENESI